MIWKHSHAVSEPRRSSATGVRLRRGRIFALASVLAVTPLVTSFPQISSPARAHPVKSHVHSVSFVGSSVAAMRTARDATPSVVRSSGRADPITTARAVAVTPVQDVAGPVTIVGVTWPKSAKPASHEFQIRTLTGATWSRWQTLGVIDGGPDPTEAAATSTTGTDPYFITGASKYEVRSLTTGAEVSAAAAVQVVDPGASGADNLAQAPGAAAAATVKPAVYTRADWGADETLRKGTPLYGQVLTGFVHHTAGTNDYLATDVPAIIRGIYGYHVAADPDGLGWDDIGYNFLIDRFGRTWEGRSGGMDKAVVGAQTLGYNSVSTGVAALGDYDTAAVPQATTDAFKQILAWKFSLAGIPATGPSPVLAPDGTTPLQRVSGHRDADTTLCPGQYLYATLPEIRAGASAILAASPPSVKYATWAYIASSRAGSAVYINALIKNDSAQGLVRGASRSIYLQRYINGGWQNMLVRTSSPTGQSTVGFIQPKVFQYRLFVTETATASSGRSGSTFR